MSQVYDPIFGSIEPEKITTVKPAMQEAGISGANLSEDDPASEPQAESPEPVDSDPESDGDS